MAALRIGIMGFGRIGRQLYKLAAGDSRFEVVAISDIGKPQILAHLLDVTMGHTGEVQLEGNCLVNGAQRTRNKQTLTIELSLRARGQPPPQLWR